MCVFSCKSATFEERALRCILFMVISAAKETSQFLKVEHLLASLAIGRESASVLKLGACFCHPHAYPVFGSCPASLRKGSRLQFSVLFKVEISSTLESYFCLETRWKMGYGWRGSMPVRFEGSTPLPFLDITAVLVQAPLKWMGP